MVTVSEVCVSMVVFMVLPQLWLHAKGAAATTYCCTAFHHVYWGNMCLMLVHSWPA